VQVLSSLLSVSAAYVYETQTFAEDDAQSFVGMLILAGVFLGIVSLMGVYAVKYENGALSRLVRTAVVQSHHDTEADAQLLCSRST
jgi:hypothetical protein